MPWGRRGTGWPAACCHETARRRVAGLGLYRGNFEHVHSGSRSRSLANGQKGSRPPADRAPLSACSPSCCVLVKDACRSAGGGLACPAMSPVNNAAPLYHLCSTKALQWARSRCCWHDTKACNQYRRHTCLHSASMCSHSAVCVVSGKQDLRPVISTTAIRAGLHVHQLVVAAREAPMQRGPAQGKACRPT